MLPYETVYVGEELMLKMRLIDRVGQPILNASVNAYSDFFTVPLYDDGKHRDDRANDGIYANYVVANTAEGVHTITVVYEKGEFSDTVQFSVRVIPKPMYEVFVYAAVIVVVSIFVSIAVWKKTRVKREVLRKIKELESRKKDVQELIKKTEQQYFRRIIDEKTFAEALQKHRQTIMEIDMELKKLRGKKEEKVKKKRKRKR
jgi:hypothetical protein